MPLLALLDHWPRARLTGHGCSFPVFPARSVYQVSRPGNTPSWRRVHLASSRSMSEGPGSAEAARPRPSVHFTADEGWINDPYGVAWVDGSYHLYYQAVPGQVTWGRTTTGATPAPTTSCTGRSRVWP